MSSTRNVLIRKISLGLGVTVLAATAQAYALDATSIDPFGSTVPAVQAPSAAPAPAAAPVRQPAPAPAAQAVSGPGQAYYVDQNHSRASDSNPGTEQAPWKTLQAAARAALKPGDTVYVKRGTYRVSGGSWSMPAINPSASGAPGKPITFKSLPTHAAVLQGAKQGAPIGVNNRSHVVIDGFVIPNPGAKGIMIYGGSGTADGIVVQNNIIHGAYVGGFDNTEGVRVEKARNVIVRNNKIYNVHNGSRSSNASAVKTYKTENVLVENNEFFGVDAGVKEKENSKRLTVRNNKMWDCGSGFVLMNQNTGVGEQIRFHQNVVQCGVGVEMGTQASAPLRDVHIFNNTFADYRSRAINGSSHGQSTYIYNNIFARGPAPAAMADFFTRQPNTSEIKRMDFNLWNNEPKIVVGMYNGNKTTHTLLNWQQSSGLSAHDALGDPMFVNADARDFRLNSGSPAKGMGREGGVSSGKPVDLGAYPTGNEIVGLLNGATPAPAPAAAPAAAPQAAPAPAPAAGPAPSANPFTFSNPI